MHDHALIAPTLALFKLHQKAPERTTPPLAPKQRQHTTEQRHCHHTAVLDGSTSRIDATIQLYRPRHANTSPKRHTKRDVPEQTFFIDDQNLPFNSSIPTY